MTHITLVWFLARVNSQMSLEFERVWAGVGTMWTLVGALSRVRSTNTYTTNTHSGNTGTIAKLDLTLIINSILEHQVFIKFIVYCILTGTNYS